MKDRAATMVTKALIFSMRKKKISQMKTPEQMLAANQKPLAATKVPGGSGLRRRESLRHFLPNVSVPES